VGAILAGFTYVAVEAVVDLAISVISWAWVGEDDGKVEAA
jgi:hypothetical protein